MNKNHLKIAVMCAMVGSLWVAGGCAKKQITTTEETPPQVETLPEIGTVESLEARPVGREPATAILEGRTTGPMRPIYFDFDKSNIRDDQKDRMTTNATYLKDNPNAVVTIEGNCDERGTNEYNIALGDRRANSAKKYLAAMGVDVKKLSTVSYGEEKPLNFGHDELAWSQNRRDDFVQWK